MGKPEGLEGSKLVVRRHGMRMVREKGRARRNLEVHQR